MWAVMIYDAKYGPYAQTPEQRAGVVRQLLAACRFKKAPASVERLYARYIAGELSWTEVRALRDNSTL